MTIALVNLSMSLIKGTLLMNVICRMLLIAFPIRNTHIWNIYETYSKHICQYMSYMCHICRHIYEHICTLGNICALICTYTSVHVCNIYAPLHICVHIFTLICAYMWAQYKYHIWHLTYMVHICQYYMQHICQMPYMLLILSIYKCACM